ncbi:MAG: DUF4097 family beta strand repeat-containing protein [Lachnospiraceae bacterium]|nr:DUF4097 family beta strand repeat-containing protein [Lachnospiraceae bacterium]
MNGIQKVIKYCAMAFAIFLSVMILGSIVTAVLGVTAGVTGITELAESKERIQLSEQYSVEDARSLEIKNILVDCQAEITVERGEKLSIEAFDVTDDYEIRCANGTFCIVQDRPAVRFNWIFNFGNSGVQEKVVVTIPAELSTEQITVKSGSYKVFMKELNTEKLCIDSGSGKVSVADVQSADTELYTGSGSVRVEDSSLGRLVLDSGSGAITMNHVTAENAKFDSGSGAVSFDGKLTGRCEFKTGSGAVSLSLEGREEDYRLKADCGSGTFRVNGKKREDGSYGTNVEGELLFDTGSGSVNLEFLTLEKE